MNPSCTPTPHIHLLSVAAFLVASTLGSIAAPTAVPRAEVIAEEKNPSFLNRLNDRVKSALHRRKDAPAVQPSSTVLPTRQPVPTRPTTSAIGEKKSRKQVGITQRVKPTIDRKADAAPGASQAPTAPIGKPPLLARIKTALHLERQAEPTTAPKAQPVDAPSPAGTNAATNHSSSVPLFSRLKSAVGLDHSGRTAALQKPSQPQPVSSSPPNALSRLFHRKQVAPISNVPALATAKTATPNTSSIEPDRKPFFKRFPIFKKLGDTQSSQIAANSKIPNKNKILRPTDWKNRSVISVDDVALFEFGPSQTSGPDERLAVGTLVRVNREDKGWALVEVVGGRTGYIDAASLRRAERGDFRDPPAPKRASGVEIASNTLTTSSASAVADGWSPAAQAPDLPDQPAAKASEAESALLLLPSLERTTDSNKNAEPSEASAPPTLESATTLLVLPPVPVVTDP